MTVRFLCDAIQMPQEVTAYLCAQNAAKEEARGLGELYLRLQDACDAHALYRQRGIDDDVYFATMGCFSRFVNEYFAAYGAYGFDRGWWVERQLSLRLFRLGALEYEFTQFHGANAVSVHIPSDADLSPEAVTGAYEAAKKFIAAHFGEYANAPFFCNSWLLSPALEKLLPPSSNIRRFARRFEITETDEDATDYIRWVYKIPDLSPERFSEDTSLRRSIKYYVLAGGKIGNATGIWKNGSLAFE